MKNSVQIKSYLICLERDLYGLALLDKYLKKKSIVMFTIIFIVLVIYKLHITLQNASQLGTHFSLGP